MDIQVRHVRQTPEWVFEVTVAEGAISTHHRVRLSNVVYQRVTGGRVSPSECIRLSFMFLLEREPKEAILQDFSVDVIGRYFPEYEAELARRLD